MGGLAAWLASASGLIVISQQNGEQIQQAPIGTTPDRGPAGGRQGASLGG
jgi:hypothetical protein